MFGIIKNEFETTQKKLNIGHLNSLCQQLDEFETHMVDMYQQKVERDKMLANTKGGSHEKNTNEKRKKQIVVLFIVAVIVLFFLIFLQTI